MVANPSRICSQASADTQNHQRLWEQHLWVFPNLHLLWCLRTSQIFVARRFLFQNQGFPTSNLWFSLLRTLSRFESYFGIRFKHHPIFWFHLATKLYFILGTFVSIDPTRLILVWNPRWGLRIKESGWDCLRGFGFGYCVDQSFYIWNLWVFAADSLGSQHWLLSRSNPCLYSWLTNGCWKRARCSFSPLFLSIKCLCQPWNH